MSVRFGRGGLQTVGSEYERSKLGRRVRRGGGDEGDSSFRDEQARLEAERRLAEQRAAEEAARLEAERKAQEEAARQAEIQAQQQRRVEFILRKREEGQALTQAEGFFLRGRGIEPSRSRARQAGTTLQQEKIRAGLEEAPEVTLEERQTETFRAKTGEQVPITEVFYVERTKEGELLKSRKATAEETKFFRSQREYEIKPESKITKLTRPIIDPIKAGYKTINVGMIQSYTSKLPDEESIFTIKQAEQDLTKETSKVERFRLKSNIAIQSFVKGIYTDIKYKPAKQAAIVAGGVVTGGVGAAAFKAAPTLTTYVGTGIFGAYAVGVGGRVAAAPSISAGAEIAGVAVKDVALFGAGSKVGAKAFSYVQQPITIKRQVRAPKDAFVIEEARYVRAGGKEYKVGKFTIVGEKTPPIEKISTTRFRETFGIKPYASKIIPAKVYKVTLPQPAINQRPFVVTKVAQGSKFAEVTGITGKSKPINLRTEFKTLSKPEQFAFKRLAASKPAPKLFRKGADLTRSVIQTERFGKLGFKGKQAGRFKITPAGRRTRLNVAATEVAKPVVDTSEIKVSEFKTVFKDVSKPFARARGKTPSLQGVLIEYKKPVVLDKTPVLTPKGKPVSYGKLSQVTRQVAKPLPKPVIKPAKTIPETRTVGTTKTKTQAVTVISKAATRTIQTPRQLRVSRSAIISKVKPVSKIKTIPKVREISKQRPATKVKEISKVKTISKVKQAQKQKQALKLKQALKFKTLPRSIPTRVVRPTKEPIKTPLLSSALSKKQTQAGKFTVLVRRYGKFKPIGIYKTPTAAFRAGRRVAAGTLAASFKVTGSKLPKVPKGFYQSKKEKGVFIEKRGFRLSKIGEKKEIQLAKKRKGGKK